jgi:hypothetical protein
MCRKWIRTPRLEYLDGVIVAGGCHHCRIVGMFGVCRRSLEEGQKELANLLMGYKFMYLCHHFYTFGCLHHFDQSLVAQLIIPNQLLVQTTGYQPRGGKINSLKGLS